MNPSGRPPVVVPRLVVISGGTVGAGYVRQLLRALHHLVWGVATIPAARLHAARRALLEGLALGPRRYLVTTASHCHGLTAGLEVTPRTWTSDGAREPSRRGTSRRS